jgi:large conductance mechanosensitive channel
VIFLMVKAINRLFAEEQNAPPPPKPPSREEELLAEIRDLLKARA